MSENMTKMHSVTKMHSHNTKMHSVTKMHSFCY